MEVKTACSYVVQEDGEREVYSGGEEGGALVVDTGYRQPVSGIKSPN